MTSNAPLHLPAALRRRRYLISWWPWRALAYAVTTVPIAGVLAFGLLVVVAPSVAVVNAARQGRPIELPIVVFLTVAGLVMLALAPVVSAPVAAVERWRLGVVDQRPLPGRWLVPGQLLRSLAARYTSAAAWREVAYTFWLGGAVPVAYWMFTLLALIDSMLIASPWLVRDANDVIVLWTTVDTPRQAVPYAIVALLLVPVLWYLFGLLVAGQAVVARWLLGGPPADPTALREVARSRARLVDAYETERRRIERDVHDGAQPRLTSLTVQLGLARLDVPADSPAAGPLAVAHEQAKDLMVTLRQIVQGIRPQNLAELGLAGAARELAGEATIPVVVRADLTRPVPELVETTAYFVLSESLNNVARHAGATRAEVRLSQTEQHLVLEVEDDGRGGADPARGSGLTGLADRVAAVDGRLLLASPTGGPTLVRVELPCRP
ncbi:sensor histidine kinase [Micromonospora echinospora]|uniref:histidine kinase n=1 Tax=Micromonospora echinospora TaxID=1877 RepID=A0A1C4XEX9_MICEC|nr:sensor domain-containing protein [Micromonospora echinospora]OZV82374.1 sensor histidine kinase [Micromonospora echinospora]SCF07089.1 Signal transduction histidine kinase [Micromonospora echinospora]